MPGRGRKYYRPGTINQGFTGQREDKILGSLVS